MKQSNKITIFESTTCCSGGDCCPGSDSSMIGLEDTLENIKKAGIIVERYSITQNLRKFMESPIIMKLIQEQHIQVLPITMLNGNVVKTGSYPSEEELRGLVQDDLSVMERKVV